MLSSKETKANRYSVNGLVNGTVFIRSSVNALVTKVGRIETVPIQCKRDLSHTLMIVSSLKGLTLLKFYVFLRKNKELLIRIHFVRSTKYRREICTSPDDW